MSRPQSTDKAWEQIIEYARQPDTTIETVQRNSENEIGVDTQQSLYFRKNGGRKRLVSRDEFNQVWKTFQEDGELTRKEVGDLTSERAGSALFGAINDILDFELDTSTSPVHIRHAKNRRDI